MTDPTWHRAEEEPLNRESLRALLANEIPAVRIPHFATDDECAAFAAAVYKAGLKYYSVAKKIGYIGMAQYEYRWDKPKEAYFADVPAARAWQQRVFDASFDAVARLCALLAPLTDAGIGIAREELGDYFAGIIRHASEGVDLHADFAPFNAPHYLIGQIDSQLGWNFYAEELVSGGETTVHNRPWTPDMSSGEIPQSYNLPRDTVEGAPAFTFTPNKGDVVIFNTRNPHEIAGGVAGEGRNRISIGSFIGRLPSGELVLWA